MSLFTGEFVAVADASTCGPYKIQNILHINLPLVAASPTTGTFFICPVGYQVVAVREIHATAGGTGATVNIEKLTGTTAPGSGTAILTTGMLLTGTANTLQTTAATNIILAASKGAAGDRFGYVLTGTLTGLANCCFEVSIARI